MSHKKTHTKVGFFEVLKLTKNRASMPEYTGLGFEVSALSGKGKQIDTTTDRFVASFPYAKITNVYPNEEYAGIAKVYIKSSETNKYVEDSILFFDIKRIAVNPATGATADEAGAHLHFGEDSVAIDSSSGKHYAAVSSSHWFETADGGISQEGQTSDVWIFEDIGNGYDLIHYLNIAEFSSGIAVVEICGDHLFVGDYVAQKVYVYSITKLKLEDETPTNVIQAPIDQSVFECDSFGRTLVCNDGKNLIIGDPEATVTYVLGESKKITTGAVFQYQLTGGNTWSKVKNILPDFLGASPPNEIDNAYADETSGVIDLNCKFGQYIDIRKITDGQLQLVVGSPRWYDDSNQDLLDNRTGGVFIYTLEEDTVATIRNATKRIVKASTTSDDTFAVFELGTGVSIDESFNIYSLYNKDPGSILKYTFNGGAQRDWTEVNY